MALVTTIGMRFLQVCSLSEVERGFNIMKDIRGKDRWLLGAHSLDGLMKIRIEKKDIDWFDADEHTDIYLKRGHLRCDDPTPYTWLSFAFIKLCDLLFNMALPIMEFQVQRYKIRKIFFPKWKLLNFENWTNGEPQ